MFSLVCFGTNGWENDRDAGDFRRFRAHYHVTVMKTHLEHPHDSKYTPHFYVVHKVTDTGILSVVTKIQMIACELL